MKFMKWEKDGGKRSTVHGLYILEIKSLFSVVLLRFDNGSREAYHEHAFHCINWVLTGQLWEYILDEGENSYRLEPRSPSWRPWMVYRSTFHKVVSRGTSWVISFRGPWSVTWREYLETERRTRTLTHGRIEV